MAEIGSLRDLIAQHLEDTQGTEEEVDALLADDVINKVEATELRDNLKEIRANAKQRIKRLAVVFKALGREPKASRDDVAELIRKKMALAAAMKGDGHLRDLAVIWAVRKYLHLLRAQYANLKAQAKAAGLNEAVTTLKESVDEVSHIDDLIAQRIEAKMPAHA